MSAPIRLISVSWALPSSSVNGVLSSAIAITGRRRASLSLPVRFKVAPTGLTESVTVQESSVSDNLNACITDAIGRLVWREVPSAETIVYAIEFSQREFAGTRR